MSQWEGFWSGGGGQGFFVRSDGGIIGMDAVEIQLGWLWGWL